ncbi:MAG TPA: nuclear transport factor 2 family protein [Solirubrobacteraceae bacterium]|nr:nuclear transport factor 2 family protein [Solirubrobacteraceae bacterium]
MPSENVDLVRRGFEAIVRGDLHVIGDMLDPQVKWHGGDPESGCRNRDEALEFMRQARRRGIGRLVDVIDAGEGRVVVVLQPPAAPGAPPPSPRANVTTVRDGRVVEMVAYETAEEACAAAGAPAPGHN